MLQPEFSFEGERAGNDGLAAWREARAREMAALARRIGMPIGHRAEVWLKGEIRLRGMLQLARLELLVPDGKAADLRLEIEGVTFQPAEIESCVRLD